ncbi:MAG TPA: 2-phospho-L-lactate transferase CofD family protein [Streptosporangiaceae bacterium]
MTDARQPPAAPGAPPGRPRSRSVVALGGGHGLYASLSGLRRVTRDLTAVVTVADDGGSSGRLRREFGVLPPGDLRMALAALCGDDAWGTTWSRVIQHRFADAIADAANGGVANGGVANGGVADGGDGRAGAAELAGGAGRGGGAVSATDSGLSGHAVGNVLIVALWELLGDTVQGLDWVARLLGAHGRVLPMSSVPLDLVAEVEGADPEKPGELSMVRGQVACATTTGRVRSVSLIPADPPACPEAVQAIGAADWVVLGPGSWFTSVLPHLLVPDLAAALIGTRARRLVALNLAPQPGETEGFSPHAHLEVLAEHAPALSIDVVLADRGAAGGAIPELEKAAGMLGARLVLADLAVADGSPRHDPRRLAGAFAQIFEGE